MSPSSVPSGRRTIALHDPATRTVGVTSSSSATVATLCGIVTSAPRMFESLNSTLKNCGKSSGLTPIGITTASIPALSNHGL